MQQTSAWEGVGEHTIDDSRWPSVNRMIALLQRIRPVLYCYKNILYVPFVEGPILPIICL